ncbi:MAG TPA: zinc metalloprotease HtpX [Candidatus Acidoferrales bacterium]|nr:zinc metalloprotease HtpX [Candidatus Acidoferrales bacterium]
MHSGNAIKTVLVLGLLSGLLLFAGDAFGGPRGLTLALAIAVLMNGGAYFFSDKIALASSHAQPVSRQEAPKLYDVVERLCGKANLPLPKLYVIPEQAPNAFATGRNPNHASVAVTVGLMELMNEDELEGVIAHELSHVRNYDILTTSVAATLAAAITFLARMAGYSMMFGGMGRDDDDRRGGGVISAVLMIFLAPLAAMLLQLMISRRREYAADESGARLVGHPYGLISALEKLGAYNQRIPMASTPATSSLYIVRPHTPGEVLAGLFSTHPPLADRIETLRQMNVTR